jgi:hypothetical protein
MEEKVGVATESASRLIKITAAATLNAKKAAEATGDEAEAFAQAAKASTSAASALRATVQANTAGVIATVAGDTQKADEAFEASEKASQEADMALGFAEEATDAAEAGKLAQAMLAADSAELLETTTEELTKDVIQVLWEEALLEKEEKPPAQEGVEASTEEMHEERKLPEQE